MTTDFSSLPLIFQVGEPLDKKLQRVVETSQFCFVCITIPLYVFVTWILIDAQIRNVKELSTAFFKLCISTAFIDIVSLFNNYLGAMFPKWGWGTRIYLFLDSFYVHSYLYIAWTVGVCQTISVTLIATNRLSAILFPSKYTQIWRPSCLLFAMCLQFLPGMIAGLATFFNQTKLYRNSDNGLIPKFMNDNLANYFFLGISALLLAACVYSTFAYCYLVIVLRKKRIAMKNTNLQKSKPLVEKKELKLLIMSSITVAIQMTAMCLFVSYATNIIAISLDEFYLIYNVIIDLYAGVNPYLLFIFSDSLRKHILVRIGLKRSGVRMQSTSSVATVLSCSTR